jgi:hypothetical protein
MVLPEEMGWVILGTLMDLAIVVPLLMAVIYKKNFSVAAKDGAVRKN